MKKKFLLLTLIFPFLFGCTVNYDVTIYDNKIDEEATVLVDNNSNNLLSINAEMSTPTFAKYSEVVDTYSSEKIPGVDYYNKTRYNSGNLIGINYKFSFDSQNYYDALIPNKCYDKFSFVEDGEYYIFSVGEYNKCFSEINTLDHINVRLKTNHKVVENNSDEIKNGYYCWNINKNNYKNKPIYVKIYQNKYVIRDQKNHDKRIKIILFISLFIAISLFIVIIILRKKANRNNKI
ncbi:MAG: hypothetical protein SPI91_04455 [Bacilli bacterium]|nr:hypothetical protein [Bacilli bacterium]